MVTLSGMGVQVISLFFWGGWVFRCLYCESVAPASSWRPVLSAFILCNCKILQVSRFSLFDPMRPPASVGRQGFKILVIGR